MPADPHQDETLEALSNRASSATPSPTDTGASTAGQNSPSDDAFADRLAAFAGADSELTTAPVGQHRFDLPQIPGFELLGELGRGGMGVVYKARHITLNRTVALKTVLHAAHATPTERVRFLAEAEAVAAVDHPHVVRVHEFGQHDGSPYFAMEFLPAGSLSQKIRGAGKLPPAEAADLVEKIARGVQAAHDLGIVHRDMKPQNVLLTEAGEPKVTDFGLAKRGAGAELTQTDAVLGTPAYMSPEQAKGRTKFVGPAADVYGLGTILYECLAGKPPFTGQDSWSVLQQVMNDDPEPVSTLVPGVSRDLDLICRKCLEKNPHDRYPTAGALADDLRRFLGGEPVGVRPAGLGERAVKWARRNPWLARLAVGIVAVLLLGVVGTSVGLVRALDAEKAAREEQAKTAEALRQVEEEQANTRAALVAQTRAKRFALDAFRPLVSDDVFQLLGQQGQRAGFARDMLTRLGTQLERLTGELGDGEEDRAFRAFGLYKLATVRRMLGDWDEVVPMFRRAQHEYAKLVADVPTNTEYRMHSAGTHNDLAVLLLAQQKYAHAEGELRAAKDIQTRLVADFPAAKDRDLYRQRLALTSNNLGVSLRGQSKLEEAEREYRRAIAAGEELAAEGGPTAKAGRHVQARAWVNLGSIAHQQKDWERAVTGYQTSLDIYAKLREDWATNREVQQEYAVTANNLGLTYREMKQPATAAEHHALARDAFQKLFDKLPGDFANRSGLASAWSGLAVALDDQKQYEKAIDAYQRASEIRAGLPDTPNVQDDRYRGHRSRALALEKLDRTAEAAKDWAAAADLADTPARKTTSNLALARCLALLGDAARAGPRADAGITAAKAPTATQLYDAACVFALCAGTKGTEPAASEKSAVRAVELLVRAVAAGYKDGEHIDQDDDWRALRTRPDFLAARAKIGPPVAPPPRAK